MYTHAYIHTYAFVARRSILLAKLRERAATNTAEERLVMPTAARQSNLRITTKNQHPTTQQHAVTTYTQCTIHEIAGIPRTIQHTK